MYESVSGLNLIELTGNNDRNATLRIANSEHPGQIGAAAYAYLPNASVEAGDIWYDRSTESNPILGNRVYRTAGHELGHALGLKHGHETGGIRNVAMNSDRDSMEFSIMTYRSYVNDNRPGYHNETFGFAQSLMTYDIRAIQQMYGANFNHNAGNTTYSFSTTTGEMFVNGIGQGQPGGNRIFRTIWDGNGVDTYNFSNYTTNLSINLSPGGWSDLDVGGNFQRADLGDGNRARGHVFNALQFNGDARSLIENAYGGSGNDRIDGNVANNYLNGGNGNDTLSGNGGSDILDGGTGNDSMYGGTDNDTYYVNTMSDQVIEYSGQGTDLVYSSVSTTYKWLPANVENLTLTGTAYSGDGNDLNNFITGNDYNNVLYGYAGNDNLYGLAGNDVLDGGIGNDVLNGGTGNDAMYGGTGDDQYVVDSVGDTVNEGVGAGTDAVFVSFSYTLGANLEALTLIGTAANGYGNSLNNAIYGNAADNSLYGYDGNDLLSGNDGDDSLSGGNGSDTLYGGNGSDTLSGWDGNDVLAGGAGTDTLTGGAGADIFLFSALSDRIDIITDFKGSEGDKIQISRSGFGASLLSQFSYNSSTGALFYDPVGAVGATQFATIANRPSGFSVNLDLILA